MTEQGEQDDQGKQTGHAEEQAERRVDPRLVRIIRLSFFLLPVLAIVLPEGLGRLYFYVTAGVPGKSYGLYHNDPVAGGIPRPNSYTGVSVINGQGFRNLEDVFTPKPEGSRRIITYGGSTTFCFNVPTDQSWPLRLQELLRSQPGHERDQVLNGGVVNWSLGHALVRAEREIPRFKPDYVFVYSGFNEWKNDKHLLHAGTDMKDLLENGQYGVVTKTLPQSSRLLQNSLLYKFYIYYVRQPIYQWIEDLNPREEVSVDEADRRDQYFIENYLQVLRELERLTRENGGQLVFVTQTARTPGAGKFPWWLSPSRAGADLARTMGATVLVAEDMVGAYRGERADVFYTSGIHFSAMGNRQFAQFIFQNVFDD